MTLNQSFQTTLLISSRKDPAGTLIHEEIMNLIEEYPDASRCVRHWYADERLIYLDGPSLPSDTDRILFLSRHASVNPRPVLTVHVTGNFGQADYGGSPHTLTPAAPELMHSLLNGLVRYAPDGYEVMYEATHHGPTNIPIPSCFVEIGSTETEWHDREGARAVARAVLEAVTWDSTSIIPMAGFGGTHYAQRQSDITKLTRGGFGHIMPTRDIQYLTDEMFQDIITKSRALAIYIDGKSVSGKEERLIAGYAGKYDIPVLGQGDLARLKEMSFSDYLEFRELALRILPGSSPYFHNITNVREPGILTISPELIDEVMKCSPDKFISALDSLPIVHLTGKGKACQPVFIINSEDSKHLSDFLVQLSIRLLQEKFNCSIEGDSIIIRKSRFDLKKAQQFGLPSGPLYSELMSGKSVSFEDNIIHPDMVMTETEKRIHISSIFSKN